MGVGRRLRMGLLLAFLRYLSFKLHSKTAITIPSHYSKLASSTNNIDSATAPVNFIMLSYDKQQNYFIGIMNIIMVRTRLTRNDSLYSTSNPLFLNFE